MTALDICQYTGVALGLAGAILVAAPVANRRRLGFGIWVLSNIALITWAIAMGAWGLLAMYGVYSITSVMGWVNNTPRQPVGAVSSPTT